MRSIPPGLALPRPRARRAFPPTAHCALAFALAASLVSPASVSAQSAPPRPGLSVEDATVDGGGAGTRNARVTVRLSAPASQSVSVQYQTRDGSARAGQHYQTALGGLQFLPEETVKTIEVPVFGGRVFGEDRDFFVELTQPINADLTRDRGRVTIRAAGVDELRFERVSPAELTVEKGDEVGLRVRATSIFTGQAVPGLEVDFAVDGDASFVAPPATGPNATVVTGSNGEAGVTVAAGETPGEVRVSATLRGGEPLTFRITVRRDLADHFGPDRPGSRSVGETLDRICRDPAQGLAELCGYLRELGDDDARRAVEELTPRSAAAAGVLAREGAWIQLRNLTDHLALARRGHRGGLGGLALVLGREPVAAAALGDAPLKYASDAGDRRRFSLLLGEALERGIAGPAATVTAQGGGNPSTLAAHPRRPRWSFFLSGRLATGERRERAEETGFDLDTLGLTAGLDFAATSNWLLGIAGGWLDTRSEFFADGGRLDAEGFSVSAFSGYARDGFYFDLVGSWGRNSYQLERHIDLPAPFLGESRLTARAEPDGDQRAAAVALGYDASRGAATLGGFLRASWVEATIDPFQEEGAGPADLFLEEQRLESLLTEAGVEATLAVSRSWGVFLPQVRASWLREHEDDVRLVRGRFVRDLDFLEFVVPTEVPDRDYFNIGAGFTLTFARGFSFFLFADRDLERDEMEQLTLSGGMRFEL